MCSRFHCHSYSLLGYSSGFSLQNLDWNRNEFFRNKQIGISLLKARLCFLQTSVMFSLKIWVTRLQRWIQPWTEFATVYIPSFKEWEEKGEFEYGFFYRPVKVLLFRLGDFNWIVAITNCFVCFSFDAQPLAKIKVRGGPTLAMICNSGLDSLNDAHIEKLEIIPNQVLLHMHGYHFSSCECKNRKNVEEL